MIPDYRDLALEMRADEVADLREEVVAYRMLAQAAIHALHKKAVKHDRLRKRHYRLIDQYRALRAQRRRESEAA
jgi:hypothetical protein